MAAPAAPPETKAVAPVRNATILDAIHEGIAHYELDDILDAEAVYDLVKAVIGEDPARFEALEAATYIEDMYDRFETKIGNAETDAQIAKLNKQLMTAIEAALKRL